MRLYQLHTLLLCIFYQILFASLRVHSTYALRSPGNSINPNDGFSGCLLLRDDNDRLPEWIAYHWLVLPLKYLVIAIDPNSTTSPQKIIDQWTAADLGIEIILWHDVDYNHWINPELDEKHQHRQRQKHFLARCEQYHKEKGRDWLAIIDPDEFITYNIIADDDPEPERYFDTTAFEKAPPKYFEPTYRRDMYELRERARHAFRQGTTIWDFIKEEEDGPWKDEKCYLMPRLLFSAVESMPYELEDAQVDSNTYDVMKFTTLRYFRHASKDTWRNNHYGKVLIDLSRLEDEQITTKIDNIHVPIPSACNYPFRPFETGIFRVHHYLGSWDVYSAKGDVRRTRDRFDLFAGLNIGVDYQLQSWLRRFVDKVGDIQSQKLLQYSGIVEMGSVRYIDTKEFVKVEENKESEYYYGK